WVTTRVSSSMKERPWGPWRLDDSISTQSVKSTLLPAAETEISTSTTRILFLAYPAMARRLLLGENFTSSVRPRLARACRTSAEAVNSISMLMRVRTCATPGDHGGLIRQQEMFLPRFQSDS